VWLKLQNRSSLGGRRQGLVVLACAAALTVVLSNLEFNLLEANLYDFRMARGTQSPASPDIVLVTLDDSTTKTLDEFAPLPLDFHAQFLEALERLRPSAVGYLVDLNQVNQANPDLFHTD
jgi:CHASE2 domain-containing sensor protein